MPINPLIAARAQDIPSHIKLIATPSFARQLAITATSLCEPPCNVVVNNHYAEAPEYAALRAALQRVQDEVPFQKDERSDYPSELGQDATDDDYLSALAPDLYISHVENSGVPDAAVHAQTLKSIYAEVAGGLRGFVKNHAKKGILDLWEEVTTEAGMSGDVLHFDPCINIDETRGDLLHGHKDIRILFLLAGGGTPLFDTTYSRAAHPINIVTRPESRLKHYSLDFDRKADAMNIQSEDLVWETQPLSIVIMAQTPWTHVPCLHGLAKRNPEKPKAQRAQHVIDMTLK